MFSFSIAIKTHLGRQIVAPFSMSVNTGDKISLIGEEGNGKSSFLKALYQTDLPHFKITQSLTPSHIIFGMIQQSLSQEILKRSFIDYVLDQHWDQYGKLLSLMSLHLGHLTDNDFNRSLFSFSNGERVKIQIIKMLLMEVDCFLLDEPTNDLDLETILWLEDWLVHQSKPIIMVSHDITLVQKFSNRIIHFEQTYRKTVSIVSLFEGTYDAYIMSRNSRIQNQNETFVNQQKEKKKQEARWASLYQDVSKQLQATKGNNPNKGRLLKKKMKQVKSMKVRFDKQEEMSFREEEKAIDVRFENHTKIHHKNILKFQLDILSVGEKTLSKDIKLDIYSHDKIALVGSNGIGKSTLIKRLIKDVDCAVMHQDYHLNLDYQKSPIENLWKSGQKEDKTMITTRLGSLNFTENEMNTPIGNLSGGQIAKCSLLQITMSEKPFLILDEPTRNLSPLSSQEFYDLINSYQGAILCVTHDRSLIDHCFDIVIRLTADGLIYLK